jgi:hypothetical protein
MLLSSVATSTRNSLSNLFMLYPKRYLPRWPRTIDLAHKVSTNDAWNTTEFLIIFYFLFCSCYYFLFCYYFFILMKYDRFIYLFLFVCLFVYQDSCIGVLYSPPPPPHILFMILKYYQIIFKISWTNSDYGIVSDGRIFTDYLTIDLTLLWINQSRSNIIRISP